MTTFHQKSLVKMMIYSLPYLDFKQYQLIVGFQMVFYTPTRPKCQRLVQCSLFIITSTFISQISLGANCVTITSTKEKKSQKLKIAGTPFTKKVIAEAKQSTINNFVDDFANIMGSIFLQNVSNQIKKVVAKAKHSIVNNFIDNLTNIMGFIFLQNTNNQVKYKDRALAYHYRLFLILCDFN